MLPHSTNIVDSISKFLKIVAYGWSANLHQSQTMHMEQRFFQDIFQNEILALLFALLSKFWRQIFFVT